MQDPKKRFKVIRTHYGTGIKLTIAQDLHEDSVVNIKVLSERSFRVALSKEQKLGKKDIDSSCYFIQAQFMVEQMLLNSLKSNYIIKLSPSSFYDNAVVYTWHESAQQLTSIYRKLSLERILQIFIEACKGVEYLHQYNVIHQYLTPCSIIVTPNEVMLWNLFLAKSKFTLAPPPQMQRFASPIKFFAAPEQIESPHSDAVDVQSDIFSLGISLYFCLTNMFPNRKHTVKTQHKKSGAEAILAEAVGTHCNVKQVQKLHQIIKSATEPKKDKRTKTALIFRQQLEDFWYQLPI